MRGCSENQLVKPGGLIILAARPIPARLLLDPRHLLAFGFGTGLAPFAPGTFGTLAALPLYWLIAGLPLEYYFGVVVLLFVAGIYVCDYSSRALGVHDHSGIVWDEIVGYLITMFAMPLDFWWMVAGFVLFRFFDILKPWPIGWLDRHLRGGMGIMVDDVAAGIFALLGLHLISMFVY